MALAATRVNDLASGGNPYSLRVLRGTRVKRVGLSPSRSDWLTENTHAGLYESESTAGVNQGARAGVSPRCFARVCTTHGVHGGSSVDNSASV